KHKKQPYAHRLLYISMLLGILLSVEELYIFFFCLGNVMSFRNRVITKASIGFALGVIIGISLTAFFVSTDMNDGKLYLVVPEFSKRVGNPLLAFMIEAILSGLLGACGNCSSAVYSLESWSITKATVIHFIITVIANYAVCYTLCWVSPFNIGDNLIMLVMFVIAYTMIWLTQYLRSKRNVAELNAELKEYKAMHHI
nr:DUF3021 domain-containing protein [Lachnospiraceae bacterium]